MTRAGSGAVPVAGDPRAAAGRPVAVLVGGLSGGGQATVQVALAEALAREGRTVDLLFFGSPGPAPPRLDPGVRLVDLRPPPP